MSGVRGACKGLNLTPKHTLTRASFEGFQKINSLSLTSLVEAVFGPGHARSRVQVLHRVFQTFHSEFQVLYYVVHVLCGVVRFYSVWS